MDAHRLEEESPERGSGSLLRAADWLGELRASSWLGDLPADERIPRPPRIPPRPPMSRYSRDDEDKIPPEPIFEDIAPPPPNRPPPYVPPPPHIGGGRFTGNDRRSLQPPPLKLPPPSNSMNKSVGNSWLGPYVAQKSHASSESQLRNRSRPPLDNPKSVLTDSIDAFRLPHGSRVDATNFLAHNNRVMDITNVPATNGHRVMDMASGPATNGLAYNLGVMVDTPNCPAYGNRAMNMTNGPVYSNQEVDMINAPQVHQQAPLTPIQAWPPPERAREGNSAMNIVDTCKDTAINTDVNITTDVNPTGNEDEVLRCTGQCGKSWSHWQDVPHWSKSRPKKPWCAECGDDKPGPWNEWGSGW